MWVWVWACFFQEPPNPDKDCRRFLLRVTLGRKASNLDTTESICYDRSSNWAVSPCSHPHLLKTACSAYVMEIVSWQNTKSKYLKEKSYHTRKQNALRLCFHGLPPHPPSLPAVSVCHMVWDQWIKPSTVVKNISPFGLAFSWAQLPFAGVFHIPSWLLSVCLQVLDFWWNLNQCHHPEPAADHSRRKGGALGCSNGLLQTGPWDMWFSVKCNYSHSNILTFLSQIYQSICRSHSLPSHFSSLWLLVSKTNLPTYATNPNLPLKACSN